MTKNDRPIVYSTEEGVGERCPRCKSIPCRCPTVKSLPADQQMAAIRRETKGRGGKTVTVVYNLQLNPADLKALATRLKQACGSGGTVKDGAIEIQGDHRQTVAATLKSLGYKTKFTGG